MQYSVLPLNESQYYTKYTLKTVHVLGILDHDTSLVAKHPLWDMCQRLETLAMFCHRRRHCNTFGGDAVLHWAPMCGVCVKDQLVNQPLRPASSL